MGDKEDKEPPKVTQTDQSVSTKVKIKTPMKAKEYLKTKTGKNPATTPKVKIIKHVTIPAVPAIPAIEEAVEEVAEEDTIIMAQNRRSLSPKQIDAKPCYTVNSNTTSKSNKKPIRSPVFQSEYIGTSQGETILTSPISPVRLLEKRVSLAGSPMETTEPFIFPKKSVPLGKILSQKRPHREAISLSKRYNEISSSDSEEDENIDQPSTSKRIAKKAKRTLNSPKPTTSNSQAQTDKQTTRKKGTTRERMPPIVIEGILNDIASFLQPLRAKYGITNINVKYTRYSTLVYTYNNQDYKNLLAHVRTEGGQDVEEQYRVHFHTYTPTAEKTHAFVIRGLDNKPDTEEVQRALLEEHELETQAVYALQTQRPLYMIITSSAITLRYLKQTLRYLMAVKITVEERRNRKRIIQCHRCQTWGHATSNCYRPARCLKCAGPHLTKTCSKPREEPAKCANCNGPHPANATSCRVYQDKLAARDQQPPNRQNTYIDAPPPAQNAWSSRRLQSQQSQQQQSQTPTARSAPPASRPREDYPALPVRSQSRQVPLQRSQQPQQGSRQELNPLEETRQIMADIRRLIDLNEVNRALKDLREQLAAAADPSTKFQVYYNFMNEVGNKYVF